MSSHELTELLKLCWHRDPFRRPAFSKIVRDVRALRVKVRAGSPGVGQGSSSGFASAGGDADLDLDGDGDDVGSGSGGNAETGGSGVGLGLGVNVNPRIAWAEEVSPTWESPDMRPLDLPPSSPLQTDPNTDENMSPRSSDESYRTAETGESGSGGGSGKGKRRDSSPPTHHPYVGAGEVQTAHQVYFIPSLTPSRASSIFVQDSVVGRSGVSGRHESRGDSSEYDIDAVRLGGVGSGIGIGWGEFHGYDSPMPMNERSAELRNERRYRMLLTHEFHPSCEFSWLMVIR